MYLRVSFVRLMRKIAGYLTKHEAYGRKWHEKTLKALKKILSNKIKTASKNTITIPFLRTVLQ